MNLRVYPLATVEIARKLIHRLAAVATTYFSSGPPEPLDRSMMVQALLHQELGAFAPGPELNQTVPDFTLPRVLHYQKSSASCPSC